MIPAAFEYIRPSSLDEAGPGAGRRRRGRQGHRGQSLLPLLRLRLAYPDLLVDLGHVDGLRGVRDDGDTLWIGALTTHAEVVRDPLIREHCGLLSEATGTVADPAVRHRGTLGGSLAHADPAGDLPAVAVALGATMIARGPGGDREIGAADFFVDYLTTALAPSEILTGVRVPKLGPAWGYRYEKFHRTAQSWATVGVAAVARRSNGHVAEARIGLTNWALSRCGPGRQKRRSPGPRPTVAPCGRPQRTPTRTRSRLQICTARPTTGATWRGC
jgi:aerobic carbon-monoxide dehydrogenase medium subunit